MNPINLIDSLSLLSEIEPPKHKAAPMNIKYAVLFNLIIIIDIDGEQYIGNKTKSLINAIKRHNLKYILANCKEIPKSKYFNISTFTTTNSPTIKNSTTDSVLK
ncbi:MAG TPA: hypothetical protein PKL04_00595 [Methanofastidiosum sp.]|nr:hypothetical protein [Methanofastidiosum sp.]